MRKEHHELPGLPRAKLVREVRRHLRFYGIVPPRDDTTWRMAWQWAHAIALFYWRTRWPLASEIGSQYVLLLLTRIRNDVALKLPFRWDQRMPAIVAERLSNGSPLRIDGPSAGNVDSEKSRKKPGIESARAGPGRFDSDRLRCLISREIATGPPSHRSGRG